MIGRGGVRSLFILLMVSACQLPPSAQELRRQQQEQARQQRRGYSEAAMANARAAAQRRTQRDARARSAQRETRPVYEAREGVKIGCHDVDSVSIVRNGRGGLAEEQWNRSMDLGRCYPAVPGQPWAEIRREGSLQLLQMVQEPADRGTSRPVQLWFNEADMRMTGEATAPQ